MASRRVGDSDAEAMLGDDSQSADGIPLWIRGRNALFQVLHDMSQDVNFSQVLLFILWVFDLLFLLVIPLGPSHALPWGTTPTAVGLWNLLGKIWFVPGATEHLDGGYSATVMYASFAGGVALIVGLSVWQVTAKMGWTDSAPHYITPILRLGARVAIQGLWMPIMINLASAFVCADKGVWFTSTLTCWTGPHLGIVVSSAILIPTALLWFGTCALTYIDRVPDYTGKKNLMAAAHGRVDAAVLLLKTVLALFYTFAEESNNTWAFVLPALAAGLAWSYLYVRFLPYHNNRLNKIQVAFSFVYNSACVCALLATGLGSTGGTTGMIAFLFMIPLSLYSGWSVADMTARQYSTGRNARGHELEMSSPYAMELRARALLADGVASGVDARLAAAKSNKDESDWAGLKKRNQATSIALSGLVSPVKGRMNTALVFGAINGGEEAITRNLHLELLTNKEAQEKADWTQIDVHFFVWSRLKKLNELSDAAGASKMNVERRIRFERLSFQVREIVSTTRDQILSFWSELAAKHPELPKLQVLGVSINEHMLEAENMYQELLELAPQNASIMRGYADFLLEISNHPAKAQELLADAEQLEEEQSKSHALAASNEVLFANPVTDFDLSADTVGVLKISADRDKLGTILSSNASVCRIVGYSQREVQGKHLDDLIPSPISAVHQQIMSRFLESGETKWLGVARTTFLLHRSGHIVPVKLSVEPTGADFRCVVDTVPVPPGEMYIWCLGEAGGWRVCAMCESSMAQLGVDHLSLKTGVVTLQAFAPDAAGLIATADETGEAKAQFKLPKSQVRTRRDSMGKTTTAWQAEQDAMPVSVRVQTVQLPVLGQPIYMLRLKRAGKQSGRFSALQHGEVSNVPEEGDSDAEDGSDAASDHVAGSRGSCDDDGSASTPAGKVKAASKAGNHPLPIGHRAMGKGADASGCPFISSQGATTAPVPVPVKPSKSAAKKAHVSVAPTLLSPEHSPGEHTAFIQHVHAAEKGEGSALMGKPVAVSNEDEDDEDAFAALMNIPGTVAAPSAAATSNPTPESTHDDAGLTLTPTAVLQSASLILAEAAAADNGQAEKAVSPRSKAKKTLRMKLPSDCEDAADDSSPPADAALVPVRTAHSPAVPTKQRVPMPKDAAPVDAKPKSALKQSRVIDDDKSSASGSKHDGSVHSKGSGHSGTSATSITEIVRKGVTARAGVLESSLRNVKFAVLLTFFITAVLNVVSLLVTMQLMSEMQVNLGLVYANAVRSVLAQRMVSDVQDWRMSAVGLADPVDMSHQRVHTLVYLKQFDELNEKLYRSVDGSLPDELALYTAGNALTVQDLKAGSSTMPPDHFNHTARTLNLANGVIEFGSRMKRILDRNASDMRFVHPSGDNYWIAVNGLGSIRTGMNRSLMYADERSATQGQKILQIDTIVLIVAEACFLVAILGAILPAVTNVAKSRKQVFDTFIQVPLPIVRALRATVHKRIAALQQAEAEAEVGIDIGGKGDEFADDHDETGDDNAEENLKGLLKQQREAMRAVAKGKPVSTKGADDEDEDDADHALTTALNASANQAGAVVPGLTGSLKARRKRSKRSYRKAGSDVGRLLITFIWPVFLYMIYFLVMWDHKNAVVKSANHDKSETLWAAQMEIYQRMAAIRVRYAMSYCIKTLRPSS